MQQDSEAKTAEVLRRHADFDSARVVEVGCGDGRVTSMLGAGAASVLGVEPAASPLREARKRAGWAVFCAGVAEALPCRTARWDIVLFTLSLHHADPGPALEEAARVLRPGGRVLALEPMVEGVIQQAGHLFEDETHRLDGALRALDEPFGNNTMLRRCGTEEFATRFVFDDAADLWGYLYGYYGEQPTQERDASLMALFGERLQRDPLVLHDRLRLTVLERVSGPGAG